MSGGRDGGDLDDDGTTPSFDDDAPVDLGDLRYQDAFAFAVFWVLAAVVFLQFFTRYVLNDSLGWTEEIARYLLIVTTFAGSVFAMRKNSHIAVSFFYRFLPPGGQAWLGRAVDLIKLGFLAAASWITVKLALRTNQKMASIDVSKAVIYWFVALAFASMAFWALTHLWRHWQRPETVRADIEAGGVVD